MKYQKMEVIQRVKLEFIDSNFVPKFSYKAEVNKDHKDFVVIGDISNCLGKSNLGREEL